MYVILQSILKHSTFKKAKILAGKDGVIKSVKRVSVFDCPITDDLLEAKIIDEGDFFISGLNQFKNSEAFYCFVKLLVKLKSSGLCITAIRVDHLFMEEIIKYCDTNHFCIVQMNEDIPYAYIMDTINRFISIDNLNAINELKVDKIMMAKLSDQEKLQLLYSINESIERFTQVICFQAEARSQIGDKELNLEYLNHRQDIFINSKRTKTLIISSSNPKKLKNRMSVVKQQMIEHFHDGYFGISRINECYDIDKALGEARLAMRVGMTIGVQVQEYQPVTSIQLLISLKNGREMMDYYSSYIRKIKEKIFGDNLNEMLRTVELYVLNHGNYKLTGECIGQHENTIRYRINKVKGFLELENDPIAFHETISIAVKIGLLLDENKYDET